LEDSRLLAVDGAVHRELASRGSPTAWPRRPAVHWRLRM